METIKLIDGQFTPEEAKDVLLEIIAKKINFHKLKNFTSQVRYDQPDAESEERIKELQEAKEEFLALVQEAKRERRSLVIEATVHIALEAREQTKELCVAVESY
jgi:hypothetical protein